jgi:hypothetical protein
MKEVVAGLSKPDNLYANGLHVAGERFVLTKAEDRSLYARKVRTNFTVFSMAVGAGFRLGFEKIADLTSRNRAKKVSSSSRPYKPFSSPITPKPRSQGMR